MSVMCMKGAAVFSAPWTLTEDEEDFFTLVATGVVPNVEQFLRQHQSSDGYLNLNVNCVNVIGDSGMSVALKNSDFKMVEFLCGVMDLPKHRILLEAVRLGDVNLVRKLCEELGADEKLLDIQATRKIYFLSGPTPLMEAASRGQFEMIGYLIGRGHFIPVPHNPNCLCDEECLALLNERGSLDMAKFTLELYTAISRPEYIVFVTSDPVRYSFEIYRTLTKLSTMENSLKGRYEALAGDVRRFVAALVAQCRSNAEVELVLQQRCAPRGFLESISRTTFPRLLLAVDNNWTELIAQPIVQIVLEDKFYGVFHDWKHYRRVRKCWHFLTRSFVLPRAYLSFLICPKSKTAEFYASPLNRMLHFSATYMCFLVALIMDRSTTDSTVGRHKILFGKGYIFLYFCGLTVHSVHQILNLGWRRCFQYGWNAYDLFLIFVFSLSFAFEIASLLYFRKMSVRPERRQWNWFHPQLLAEGTTVAAYVLAFLKLFFFSQIHSGIGPLQVTLYGLMKYVISYSLFGLAILLVYTTAFTKFHAHFGSAAGGSNWLETFHSLFWAIFGMCRAVDMGEDEDLVHFDESVDHYQISQMVSYAVFGTYTVLMVIVIKNMIVALAVEAFNSQSDNARDSWLVSRTQLFLHFIDSAPMPPPFILLPQKYSFELENRKLQRADAEKGQTLRDSQKEYSKLIKTLVGRYFRHTKHRLVDT